VVSTNDSKGGANLTDLQKRALEVTGFPLINFNASIHSHQQNLFYPHQQNSHTLALPIQNVESNQLYQRIIPFCQRLVSGNITSPSILTNTWPETQEKNSTFSSREKSNELSKQTLENKPCTCCIVCCNQCNISEAECNNNSSSVVLSRESMNVENQKTNQHTPRDGHQSHIR
jgi:hypothetical protein